MWTTEGEETLVIPAKGDNRELGWTIAMFRPLSEIHQYMFGKFAAIWSNADPAFLKTDMPRGSPGTSSSLASDSTGIGTLAQLASFSTSSRNVNGAGTLAEIKLFPKTR
jgi:hypothetical protein